MTIATLKDLEKVIRLCRKTGVDSIKVDGIEILLGSEPYTDLKPSTRPLKEIVESAKALYNPGVAYTPTEHTKIQTEELTEEQLLMWSVGGHEGQ